MSNSLTLLSHNVGRCLQKRHRLTLFCLLLIITSFFCFDLILGLLNIALQLLLVHSDLLIDDVSLLCHFFIMLPFFTLDQEINFSEFFIDYFVDGNTFIVSSLEHVCLTTQ